MDAINTKVKPKTLNSVALYVNKINPTDIIITMVHKLHDWKENKQIH